MAETYSAKPLPDTQPHQATLSSRSPLPRYKTQPPHPYCSTPQSHSQDASSLSHMPTDHLPHSPHKPSLHGASLFDQACCPYPISLGCIANHPTPQLRPNCFPADHNGVMPPLHTPPSHNLYTVNHRIAIKELPLDTLKTIPSDIQLANLWMQSNRTSPILSLYNHHTQVMFKPINIPNRPALHHTLSLLNSHYPPSISHKPPHVNHLIPFPILMFP